MVATGVILCRQAKVCDRNSSKSSTASVDAQCSTLKSCDLCLRLGIYMCMHCYNSSRNLYKIFPIPLQGPDTFQLMAVNAFHVEPLSSRSR